MTTINLINESKCFGGKQQRYQHESDVLGCSMHLSVYLPPQVCETNNKAPVLLWLSGLTCTDENFMQKAGAQRVAAELGIILVAPDTSPRGEHIPDDLEKAYDFGHGAGFYLNATQQPWSEHYHMYDYITQELPILLSAHFPVTDKTAISGHSMGGHGALVIGLRNVEQFTSISAFSPICHPTQTPWGQKAFSHYLGEDNSTWENYDATCLLEKINSSQPILIDQGTKDQFLKDELSPGRLIALAADRLLDCNYRFQEV